MKVGIQTGIHLEYLRKKIYNEALISVKMIHPKAWVNCVDKC